MVTDPTGVTNGDDNFVAYNNGQVYFMPNGIAEPAADRHFGRPPIRTR